MSVVRTTVRTKANVTVEFGVIGCPRSPIHEPLNSLVVGKIWPAVAPPGIPCHEAQPDLRIRRLGVRIPPSALDGLNTSVRTW